MTQTGPPLPYYLASVCAVSFCIEYDAPNSTRVSFKKGCWLHTCTCVQQTNGSLPSQRPFLLRIHSHRSFSAATTFSALHTCAEIFQWISNFVSFCQEEDFWLMRVTFSSTCHLQLMRLNHHPPLVERWGRNKKWHKPFFSILLPPLPPLLEGTKPLGDKTVQSDSNRCEKCVVIVSPSWLLLVTVFFWNFTILQRECVQSNHVTIFNMLSPLISV